MFLAESMIAALLSGYIGITLVIVLTGCGLPIPEELPIVTAGALSGTHVLEWYIALPCVVVGAVVGDSAIWWIGYHFGRAVLTKHPWWVGFLTPEREKKAEAMVAQHGMKLLFVARFLPGVRTPVYLTTGILKMPYRKFILIDAFCALVVVSVFFGLGFLFAKDIAQVLNAIKSVEHAILYIALAAAAAIGLHLYIRRRRRMAEIRAGEHENGSHSDVEGITSGDSHGPSEPSANGLPIAESARETHPTR